MTIKDDQKQLRTLVNKDRWEAFKGLSRCRTDADFISELLRTYEIAQELTCIHSDLGVAIGIAISRLSSGELISVSKPREGQYWPKEETEKKENLYEIEDIPVEQNADITSDDPLDVSAW